LWGSEAENPAFVYMGMRFSHEASLADLYTRAVKQWHSASSFIWNFWIASEDNHGYSLGPWYFYASRELQDSKSMVFSSCSFCDSQ
jgi:hypothetical protein